MKTIWKVLIGTAAVAAVTPYKVEKDEETGAVKITSATWAATYTKNEDGKNVEVRLLPALTRKAPAEEEECCCDECRGEEEAPVEEAEDDGEITIDVKVEEEAPEAAEAPEAEAEKEGE